MLVFHIGRPGSGKSYEAAAFEVRAALKAGRAVVTNMPLNVDVYAEEFPDAPRLIQLLQRDEGGPRPFSVLEHYERYDQWRGPDGAMGPLFLIDEASQALPAAGRGTVPEEVKFWYEEHRHTGSKVVLITQQLDYVQKSIRNLADQVHAFKNLKILGSGRFYIKRTYEGPYGPQRGKAADRLEWRRYRRKWFAYYNSFTKGGGPVNEKVKPLWARPQVYLAFAFVVWYLGTTMFGGENELNETGPTIVHETVPGTNIPNSSPVRDELTEYRRMIELLTVQRDLHLARLELEHVQGSVCSYETSAPKVAQATGIFSGDRASTTPMGCKLVPAPPPSPRHLLAGATVKIASSVSVSGANAAVDILISRPDGAYRARTTQLRALGWEFDLVDTCHLAVSGPWSGVVDCYGVDIPL